MKRAFFFFFLSVWMASFVLAQEGTFKKEITLKWAPVERTKVYEVEIFRNEKLIKIQKSKNEEAKALLEAGFYQYSIRAIDEYDRPGLWSEKQPLAVLPPPPSLKAPANKQELIVSKGNSKLEFLWQAPPKGMKTQIIVKKGSKEIANNIVPGTMATLGPFNKGEFSWRARYVFGPDNQYFTNWSGEHDFEVEFGKLEKPKLLSPMGLTLFDEKSGGLKFSWEEVKGAQSYLFQMKSIDSGRTKEEKVFTPEFILKKMPLGRYEWKVRALSFIPGEFSESNTEKVILTDRLDFTPGIFVNFGIGKGDTDYQLNNELTRTNYYTKTGLTNYHLGADAWFHPYFSLSLNAQARKENLSASNKTNFSNSLYTKTRGNLSKTGKAQFEFGLGPESKQQTEIIQRGGTRSGTITLLGAGAQGDLHFLWGEKTKFSLRANYFYPLKMSGPPTGTKLQGSGNYNNTRFQLRASRLWLNSWWTLGLTRDNTSISFLTPNSVNDSKLTNKAFFLFFELSFAIYRGDK